MSIDPNRLALLNKPRSQAKKWIQSQLSKDVAHLGRQILEALFDTGIALSGGGLKGMKFL